MDSILTWLTENWAFVTATLLSTALMAWAEASGRRRRCCLCFWRR